MIKNNSVEEVEKHTSTPPVNAGKQNKRIVNNKAIVEQTVPVESNTKIPLAMKSMKETYNSQVADNYIIKERTKTNDLALLHSQTPPSIKENNEVRPLDNSFIKIITPDDKYHRNHGYRTRTRSPLDGHRPHHTPAGCHCR